MGALPDDVDLFIDRQFDEDDVAAARSLIDRPELSTPRVVRCVLYLSNGSLSLLKHYVEESIRSVTGVLLDAEYVTGVSDQPILARDMSLPFQHRRNLGRHVFGQSAARPPAKAAPVGRSATRNAWREQKRHCMSGQRFFLGEVTYVIARHQPRDELVYCYRVDGVSMTPVRLPLVFVLERLAEHIELEASL